MHTTDMTQRFRRMTAAAIEGNAVPTAIERIAAGYDQDVKAMARRAAAADTDSKALAAQLHQQTAMVHFLHTSAAAQILLNAKIEAYAAQLRTIVDQVRKVVTEARTTGDGDDTAAVPCADLEAALDVTVEVPDFQPQILAYVSEPMQSIVGHFESEDGAVMAGYPMVGWSLVLRQQEREARKLEPTYLVDGRAIPVSFIQDTYGLRFKRNI